MIFNALIWDDMGLIWYDMGGLQEWGYPTIAMDGLISSKIKKWMVTRGSPILGKLFKGKIPLNALGIRYI